MIRYLFVSAYSIATLCCLGMVVYVVVKEYSSKRIGAMFLWGAFFLMLAHVAAILGLAFLKYSTF